MFPLMGLFLFFIPASGLLLAIFLCFIKPLRFLAAFALFIPLLGSYSAVAGVWGVGIGLERAGFHGRWITLAMFFGLLACGTIGSLIGVAAGFGVNRLARYIRRLVSQARDSSRMS